MEPAASYLLALLHSRGRLSSDVRAVMPGPAALHSSTCLPWLTTRRRFSVIRPAVAPFSKPAYMRTA